MACGHAPPGKRRHQKCQFGLTKTRYKGLAKNTAQLVTWFALSNLWMARRTLMQGAKASVCLKCGKTSANSLKGSTLP